MPETGYQRMQHTGRPIMNLYRNLIDKAVQHCLAGKQLNKETIVELLEIPADSEEQNYLRKAARDVCAKKTDNTAYLWCAIGADYRPCSMNCKFCSFGEKWNLIHEEVVYSPKELVAAASCFIGQGADYVVLRTTEFFTLEVLKTVARKIRHEVPGQYDIILNTGELDKLTAQSIVSSGINGIYHSLRLREGIDTPFSPETRIATMNSVYQSPLKLVSLVEPVGSEHSSEEIADSFLNIIQYGAVISGVMARIPVQGTPLGNRPQISENRLSHITAVLRLSGGNTVKDICVHPSSRSVMRAGANVAVVEMGAIPRDASFSEKEWNCQDTLKMAQMFAEEGYVLNSQKKTNGKL